MASISGAVSKWICTVRWKGRPFGEGTLQSPSCQEQRVQSVIGCPYLRTNQGISLFFCARLEVMSAVLLDIWFGVFGWGVSDVSKDLIFVRFKVNECMKCLTLQIKAIGYYRKARNAVAQWLRCCATNRKFPVSIAADVIGIFYWHKFIPIALWPWGRLSL